MEFRDMSARKLKRKYVKHLKLAWFYEKRLRRGSMYPRSDQQDLAFELSRVRHIKNILESRGWSF